MFGFLVFTKFYMHSLHFVCHHATSIRMSSIKLHYIHIIPCYVVCFIHIFSYLILNTLVCHYQMNNSFAHSL